MSRIIVPSRRLWTTPQRQRGYVVVDAYRSAPPVTLPTVTWNPSDKDSSVWLDGGSGNLVASKGGGSSYGSIRATHAHDVTDPNGFYFEVVVTSATLSPYVLIGIGNLSAPLDNYIGIDLNGVGYYQETGDSTRNASDDAYGASYTTSDVIGVFVRNGKVYFRKNGTWQKSADLTAETGYAYAGLTGSFFPMVSLHRPEPNQHILTGRFKASSFSGSLPLGSSPWGG